ncbi:hypothetical protein [Haloarcula onubensis]|uniref:Uncharacterized protein n=1 Tax=Haloarcula onubensis TaxID=2950539 RepID=A0ABU2FQ06_9EURY|nr:hypothetical protein [Halomicroarcula sp. S3CR25-11]MDS0282276.1 hypothetical protein [Halomicroarcula sp. S3CR25-11]
MYSLSQLKRALGSPNLFFRELNRLYHRRLNSRRFNTAGIDIFDADWDNLLILDACRYDMFEEQHNLDGTLERRLSRASSTQEWLHANFTDRDLRDTVYVTANPQYYRHRDVLGTTFHAVVDVWKEEGWDEELKTVPPEVTTKHAIEAAERYPDKRLLVHYIQPHYPFLTERGQPFDNDQAFLKPDEAGSWNQVMTGELDADANTIWTAYRETLDRTLPSVAELLATLDGKSVVSADHGNMVGERATPFPIREWGHPRGIYTSELVTVPWFVVEGDRRDTVAEEPAERASDVTDELVQDRLEQLGYV